MGDPIPPRTMLDYALEWAARGFRVHPLHPGTKRPVWAGWPAAATSDPERIREVWSERDYNIGTCTDDLIVVDVDVRDRKDGMMSFFALGLPADTLTVRTPSGGFHFYYNGEPVACSVGNVADGIDIRSWHGQVVAPGSIVGGRRYVVVYDGPIQHIDPEFHAKLDKPRERTASDFDIELDDPAAVAHARQWLERQPGAIEGQGGDARTYRTAAKLKDFGLSEDTALEMLRDEWNPKCEPPWSDRELLTKVQNAYAYGKSPPGSESPRHLFAGVNVAEDAPARPRLRFLSDPDANAEPAWLVKRLLPPVGVALLFGQSRVGKSFLALDLAAALALALDWFGHRVLERIAVLIVVGEGGSTMAPRLEALRRCKFPETSAADLPIAWAEVDDGKDLESIIAEAAETLPARLGLRLGLVVIDTMTAVFNLADENDPALATNAMKRLDEWSRRFACLMLGVAHAGKDASLGVRGSSAWTASPDVILGATGDINEESGRVTRRRLALTKSRYAETGPISGFELEGVIMGHDGDGDPIRAAVVRPCVAIPKPPKRSIHSGQVLAWVAEVIEAEGQEVEGLLAAPRDTVRYLFAERLPEVKARKNVARDFDRAVAGAGIREVTTADGTWLIPPDGEQK